MANTFVQIPSELITDTSVSPLELRLYILLMDLGFKGRGFSFAGHKYLGKLLDSHPQTIAKSLKNLCELGWIKVTRVGLNRNDKIRCLKTVQKEKRSEPPVSIKNKGSHIGHSINRINKEKIIEGTIQKTTVDKYKTTPPTPIPIPKYKDDTRQLLSLIEKAIQPKSYSYWFQDKITIPYVDETSINISCLNNTNIKWLKSHYTDILNKITGKKVSFYAAGVNFAL